MVNFLRLLLIPLSILYGVVSVLRNLLYDLRILPSEKFDLPLISIGNIVVGGTGKTPMTEYLIRLLKNEKKIAILSRGYGRRTKGFILASSNTKSTLVGDEPKQYKLKFPEIIVSVCEKRAEGIRNLTNSYTPEIILLDDAFQHRSVISGVSILLMDFNTIFKVDFMLPTGNLREMKFGKGRADIIVVTKCPNTLTLIERKNILTKINPNDRQNVYFSYVEYDNLEKFIIKGNFDSINKNLSELKRFSVVALSGIANPKSFHNYLQQQFKDVFPVVFSDHHIFTEKDIQTVSGKLNTISDIHKIVITTEKDLMRLSDLKPELLSKITPLFYIPISLKFYEEDEKKFNEQILRYVRNYKANS